MTSAGRAVQAEALSLAALDDPAAPLATIDAFLREYPETPRRVDALALARSLKDDLAKRRTAVERQFVDDLIRSESLAHDLTRRPDRTGTPVPGRSSRECGARRGEQPARDVLEAAGRARHRRSSRLLAARIRRDSRARIERFQHYLKNHETGGRFVSEAIEAKDRILAEWDVYAYRQAFDHAMAHPDDVAEVAQRLRDYLRDHPDGRFAADAQRYQEWWDKISVPGQYRVTLAARRGRAARRQVLRRRGTRPGRRDRSGRRGLRPVDRHPRLASAGLGLHVSRSRSPGSSATR